MGDGRRNARTRSPAFPGEWTGAAKGRHHTIGSGCHTMGNVLVRACARPRIHLSEFVPIYFHPSLFWGHRFPWRRRDEEKVPMFFEHLPFLYERLPIFFAGEGQRGSKKRSCQSTPMEVLRIGRGPSFFRWIGRWLRLFLAKPQSVEGLRSSRVWGMNQMKSEG